MPRPTPAERFAAKVNTRGPISPIRGVTGNCHIWTACQDRHGYGLFWDGKRMTMAHRFAYEQTIGPIPAGLELDHLCRVRGCCNPKHLEPVTHAENVRRGEVGAFYRSRTACPQGHPYDEANTYRSPTGGRQCRACNRIRTLAAYHARRAQALATITTLPTRTPERTAA